MADGATPDPTNIPASSLPTPPHDRVIDLDIERELHESYLTYAMSTIMDRALPDVRDGLKPSQRKVLYACFKRKLKTEVKVAQLSGFCAEHTAYHHGEQSLHGTSK